MSDDSSMEAGLDCKKTDTQNKKKRLQQTGRDKTSARQMSEERFVHHLKTTNGQLCNGRYCVSPNITVFGRGTFGCVIEARDQRTNAKVAIKVVRPGAFSRQAKVEIQTLKSLSLQSDAARHIVQLKDAFVEVDRQCLVFDCLSHNLYQGILQTQGGVSLNLVAEIARQLLVALAHLSSPKDESKQPTVMHCDLKPENIMIVTQSQPEVKLIDFGSACNIDQQMYNYIQSRFYRAPEVLLERYSYDAGLDMWSLGCVLAELYSGKVLFDGHDRWNQIIKQVALLGTPPQDLILESRFGSRLFQQNKDKWELTPRYKPYMVSRNWKDVFGDKYQVQDKQFQEFNALLLQMLELDPQRRIKPLDALNSPFFGCQSSFPSKDPNDALLLGVPKAATS